MLSVTVVIPTFKERENIVILARQVHQVLGRRPHEILVVDDRSPDGTGEAVSALGAQIPELRLITHEPRKGIGAALRHGYDQGSMDVLASLDADLSFSAFDLLKLLERIDAGDDLVLGSRHARGGAYETPTWKIKLKFAVSRLGNIAVRLATGIDLRDFSANFRAIRRSVWQAIQTKDTSNSILLEMIVKVHRRGYKISEVPVTFSDRAHGQSKLNLWIEVPKFAINLLKYARKTI